MATRMQQRRGTAAQWTSADPILAAGEIGFESDSGEFRIGDGVNHYSDLSPFKNLADLGGSLDDYVPITELGQPNGVATLDVNGNISIAQLSNIINNAPEILDTFGEVSDVINAINDAILSGDTATLEDSKFYTDEAATSAMLAAEAHAETDAFTKVYTHNSETTSVHGIADTSALATKTYADNAVSTHESDTTSVHGIADTAALATKTYADGKASDAQSAAALALSNHEADTTSIHGIADTAALATKTYADSAVSTAVSALTKSSVGLANVDNTSDANKPVSTATQTALDLKATLAAPTFTGTVVLPSTTSIGDVSATEIGYVDGVTSAIQTQINAKAPLADPTFTGTLTAADIILSGNLTVGGTTTTVNAANLNITDPMIYMGDGNSANVSDLGIVSAFNDGTYQHTGLVRDSSAGTWKLFKGVTDEPGTTVNFSQGSLDALALGELSATSLTVGDVSNTEFGYLDGVTSAIQTQIDTKAPLAGPTFSGTVVLPSTTSIGNVSATELGYVDGVTSAIQIQIDAKLASTTAASTYETITNVALKAPLAGPTFTGLTTVSASGIAFTDGTQVKQGVPSLTVINQQAGAYTPALADRDKLVEVSSATGVTVTIPANSSVAYPVGTSIDILQTGAGQVTIAAGAGVTVNATPGLKLRTQWSSATLFKRATDTWVVFGDLSA